MHRREENERMCVCVCVRVKAISIQKGCDAVQFLVLRKWLGARGIGWWRWTPVFAVVGRAREKSGDAIILSRGVLAL